MCHGDYSSGRRKTRTYLKLGLRSSPMVGVRFSSPWTLPCLPGMWAQTTTRLRGSWQGMCPPAEADHWEAHRHLAMLIFPLELQWSLRSCSVISSLLFLLLAWRASPISHGLLRTCFLPKGLVLAL